MTIVLTRSTQDIDPSELNDTYFNACEALKYLQGTNIDTEDNEKDLIILEKLMGI